MFVIEGKRLGSREDRRRVRSWFRIPDWREPSAYPPASASGDRWAWEFLRRNDDFLSEQHDFCQRIARIPREQRLPSHPEFVKHAQFLADWGIDYWYPPAWVWGWPVKLDRDGPYQFVHMDFDAPCGFVTGPVDSSRYFDRPMRDTQYRVIFDVAMPIAPQIAQVKAMLESKQAMLPVARKTVRPRWHLFPRYLRAIDGYRALTAFGLSESQALNELADQFMSEKQHVDDIDYVQDARNALDAARRYIEHEYRVLPVMRGLPVSS
ncbi:hypothetical protein [Burkholderia sp. KJ006]|uniref:hypothetical protein n=1 Tax=Burkholderia sp. KJ006 TaxID=416344 RepID=UPI0011D22025|nr:hypothetical protein [Burkholderia sp. KJ006]